MSIGKAEISQLTVPIAESSPAAVRLFIRSAVRHQGAAAVNTGRRLDRIPELNKIGRRLDLIRLEKYLNP